MQTSRLDLEEELRSLERSWEAHGGEIQFALLRGTRYGQMTLFDWSEVRRPT